jgi:hypothetical protein
MSENPDAAQPDVALRRLDRLVGRWTMEGNLVGSDEKYECGHDVDGFPPARQDRIASLSASSAGRP